MRKLTIRRSAIVVLLMSLGVCAPQAFGQEARKLLVKPTPTYPEVAKRLNLEGTVKIEVVVGPDGEITGTKVIGGHPILVEAAESPTGMAVRTEQLGEQIAVGIQIPSLKNAQVCNQIISDKCAQAEIDANPTE